MKGFAIDMDGTVYHGERPIPGAVEFIRSLREKGIPFRFLTNNSSHGRDFYVERLNRMGFDVTRNEILSSTVATARYIAKNYPGKSVYPVGVPDFEKEIQEYGIIIDRSDPDIVLLAFDTTIDYGKINDAYHFLKDGKLFIATHPDDLCPTEGGYDIDIGPFIRMFEQMTSSKAIIIGKPNRLMLEMAALEMGIESDDVIMVGDRIYTDIRMASDNGTMSIMVLTGEATEDDIELSGIRPTFVCNSVAEIMSLGIEFQQ